MERAYLISNLWNWLPAFRTVAETEHLPTAARALHVSPSALSRSVKQLELEVGQPLFGREGGRMRLNRAGALLLVAVRDAMRRVDDGLTQVGAHAATNLRISGASSWLQLIILPALRHVVADGVQLTVDMLDGPPANGEHALLCGEVDVIVGEHNLDSEQLDVIHLGTIAHAVCRARGSGDSDPGLPFAVWSGGCDVWPPEVKREVALRTPHMAVVIEACISGHMQAVLPVAIARAYHLDMRPMPRSVSAQLYLSRRKPLVTSLLDTLVERVLVRAAVTLDEMALRVLA